MLLLASNSKARQQMLRDAGVDFEVAAAGIDEAALRGEWRALSAMEVALRLAEAKAMAVRSRSPRSPVLGADSVVELDGRLLEKPGTEGGLRAQLQRLRGRTHRLISAAALVLDGRLLWRHAEEARLRMRDFSDAFLSAYVESTGPQVLQSVGGYHVEAMGVQLFEEIEGSEFVIRGLPLLAVLRQLRGIGELPQ